MRCWNHVEASGKTETFFFNASTNIRWPAYMKKGTESVLFLVCVIICVGSSISVNKQTSFMHFNRLKNNLFFFSGVWYILVPYLHEKLLYTHCVRIERSGRKRKNVKHNVICVCVCVEMFYVLSTHKESQKKRIKDKKANNNNNPKRREERNGKKTATKRKIKCSKKRHTEKILKTNTCMIVIFIY